MIIDSLCPPAVLYLGFSVIQIIIDLFRGQQNSAFLKVIVMIVFTILLNQLCIGGLTILSWFIVFIPFIMMTYVTTILLYVFGLNPSKGRSQPQPDPRRRHRHRQQPRPYNPQEVGGCAGTEFGCCPDGVTASNAFGSNCYGPGPGPQPAPPHYHHHHHHHHGHHYPPGPGPQPGPTSTTYSCYDACIGKSGRDACTVNGDTCFGTQDACNKNCSQPPPLLPVPATNFLCNNGTCTASSCTLDNSTCFPDIGSCADGCYPPPPPGPKPQGFSCMKKHGFLTCQPGGSDYGSLKECEEQCSNPVPPPKPGPTSTTYSCYDACIGKSGRDACTVNGDTCFGTQDACNKNCSQPPKPGPTSTTYSCYDACIGKSGRDACTVNGDTCFGTQDACNKNCSQTPPPPVSSGYNCVKGFCNPSTSGAGTYNNPSCNNECQGY